MRVRLDATALSAAGGPALRTAAESLQDQIRALRTALAQVVTDAGAVIEAGTALAEHPEIPFAAATTGPSNLVASAVFRDAQHLYEYLTGELASLPGMRSVETAPIIRTLKRTGSVH